jgi:hypothetical protein
MSQAYASPNFYSPEFSLRDGPQLDSFGRLRVSNPTYVFDSQLTYNLQPLINEVITSGTGATITHDTTNRCAKLDFASTPAAGKAIFQTYEHFRYQPGRSQLAICTFIFGAAVAGVRKFAGYSDGVNGIEFQQTEAGVLQLVRYSASGAGNLTVTQANWNYDKLDGTGPSGITLDVTKGQILEIDFQALYIGRGRVAFNIGGVAVPVHFFNHANVEALPYIQTANLPIRMGMEVMSGTPTATMRAVCMSVISEGGSLDEQGATATIEAAVTAASGARTHFLSIRPKTTFNSIVNRSKFVLESIDILGGLNPVYWELAIGQAISGTTAFNDVNATYSAFEYNILGTLSGSPALVVASGYLASSATRGSLSKPLSTKIPICLDAAGAVRANGTLTLMLTGISGTSAARAALNWREIR